MEILYLLIELVVLSVVFAIYHKRRLKEQLKMHNTELNHKVETLQNQLEQIGKDRYNLSEELQKYKSDLDEIKDKNAELDRKNAKLEGRIDHLKTVEKENKEIEHKLEKIQSENKELTSKKSEYKSELEQKNNQIKEKNQNLQEFKNKLEEKEEALEQLRKSKEKLEKQVSELTTRTEEQKKSAQEKLETLEQAREKLKEEFENLANKIFEKKNKKSKENLNDLMNPLREQIKDFKKKVEDVYDKESKERSELFVEIKNLRELNSQIGEDAKNLTRALKGSSKVQGDWGEVVLERLLEYSGLKKGEMFETQKTYKNAAGKTYKPDVVLHLPDERDIVIDSKVSLKDYEEYYNAEEGPQKQKALERHIASVSKHINELSQKNYYSLEGLNSLDYVIMFVPIEGAYIAAVQHSQDMIQNAMKANVMLVGPSTLLATLKTIEKFWRFKQQRENVMEIARRGGQLHDKFVNFVESMENIGKNIERARDSYTTARKRLDKGRGNLIRQVDMLRELGAEAQKTLPDKLQE